MQVGEHYLAEGWGQQLMTLQQFVERHIAPGAGRGTGLSGSPGAKRGQQGQTPAAAGGQEQQARPDDQSQGPQEAQQQHQHQAQEQHQQQQSEPAAGRGYLAQHPLFDQIPALAADIRVRQGPAGCIHLTAGCAFSILACLPIGAHPLNSFFQPASCTAARHIAHACTPLP